MFYGPEDMRIEAIEEPSPAPGELKLEVAACGICGSDLHFYEEGVSYGDLPVTLGHEVSGTVVETGEGVELEVGTEVVLSPHTPCMECPYCEQALYNLCRDLRGTSARPGGYAEYVVESADNAIPLPDGVDVEDAAIAQPVAVGMHAVRISPLGIGDSAFIAGAGPIGLGALSFAASSGAAPIFVSEPQDFRREAAADFGADVLIDPTAADPVERVRAETDVGVDVAIEAVGHQDSLLQCIEATRSAGQTTIIGVFGDDVEVNPSLLVGSQRNVQGSCSHQLGPEVFKEYTAVLRQINADNFDIDQYVTSRIGLEGIVADGFEGLLDEDLQERKILVCP